MQEESIYNLVPKEYVPPPKEAKYKSKFPANLPPTGSTFCHKTTSKPGVYHFLFRFLIFQESWLKILELILTMEKLRLWDISKVSKQ